MTRRPPPRPVALWIATLIVTLQCSWCLMGGVVRLAQDAIDFDPALFAPFRLPRTNDPAGAAVLAAGAAAVLACHAAAVLLRVRLAAAIVGVLFLVAGLVLLCGTGLLAVMVPGFLDAQRGGWAALVGA